MTEPVSISGIQSKKGKNCENLRSDRTSVSLGDRARRHRRYGMAACEGTTRGLKNHHDPDDDVDDSDDDKDDKNEHDYDDELLLIPVLRGKLAICFLLVCND